ncbi:B12-binding domain-containing radical SAM protein [Saccharicrinis sp. FJH62]|uniref:B12-binding domain-containing radical SAM protein n=1 Tax=Saccharicrinis sp. FJH62 TaxID=3344657 RepID=UPI0035D4B80E
MKPGILFTSPCGPYAKLPMESDPIDYFYYRNTYKQKIFQLRSFQSWHSLHYLAQNIPVSSVVLENPSTKAFRKEVNTGKYQIVAIGFTILLTHKVLEMAEWLKQNHPGIEIVLGGYGTAVFKESFEKSGRLKEIVDHICYGEGLAFMNALIQEKWDLKNQIERRQDLIPSENSFFRTRIKLFRQIILVGGLGCVYGCSFCATSSQFKKKYIPLLTGQQIVEHLLSQRKKYPGIQSAVIYDEDFLHDRAKVLDYMNHFQNSDLKSQPFLLTIFASVRSILNYSIEELIACGIGTVFIGVESLNDEVLEREGLTKRKGKVEALFEKLHAHGINTLGSLVIGWDNQTADITVADSQRFIGLNPTFYQVVPLHVVPGTKLWDVMKREGRISSGYRVEKDGINDFNFVLKNYSDENARELIASTYSGLVNEGGPWPFRMFENLLNGYLNLKNNNNQRFSERAAIYKSMIFPVCILAVSSGFFFQGSGFKKRWRESMKAFAKILPTRFVFSALISPLVILYLSVLYISGNFFYRIRSGGDQPDYIRKVYNTREQ